MESSPEKHSEAPDRAAFKKRAIGLIANEVIERSMMDRVSEERRLEGGKMFGSQQATTGCEARTAGI